jgi:predicted ATP-grasp superfamily ATP-dependent carboligase
MGDIDVVRPLVAAGIPCAAFSTPRDPVRFSRHVRATLPWIDHYREQDALTEALLRFAAEQASPPVLFPQSDADLLLTSRRRDRLDGPFRFLLADAALIEDLVDKVRFRALAERLDLPVPRSRPLAEDAADLRFPLVAKPLTWSPRWRQVEPEGKALELGGAAALAELRERAAALGLEVLVQEMVPGGESRMESHHAYVDAGGALVADFTGRKVRTYPPRFGDSTAVEITDAADVRDLGREILRRLGLRGMSKLDFKRAPDGSLHLLEVNPRVNLWHHPGALAGVNLPALMYADLTGGERPAVTPARAGVTWCQPLRDARAARAAGEPLGAWLRWVARCDARSDLAWDDPLPFLRGRLLSAVRRRVGSGA